MTLKACVIVMSCVSAKLTRMTVVALELCSMTVMSAPRPIAEKRLLVNRPIRRRSRSPAASCNPLRAELNPKKKKARPPIIDAQLKSLINSTPPIILLCTVSLPFEHRDSSHLHRSIINFDHMLAHSGIGRHWLLFDRGRSKNLLFQHLLAAHLLLQPVYDHDEGCNG